MVRQVRALGLMKTFLDAYHDAAGIENKNEAVEAYEQSFQVQKGLPWCAHSCVHHASTMHALRGLLVCRRSSCAPSSCPRAPSRYASLLPAVGESPI